MPDETHTDADRHPTMTQNVNVPEAVNGGLQGAILKYAQTSIITFFLIGYAWMEYDQRVTARQDRLDDRQVFRESVKALQDDAARHFKDFNDEQNRRAAEQIATLNYNSGRVQDLTTEVRGLRRVGILKSDGDLPRAQPPQSPPSGP